MRKIKLKYSNSMLVIGSIIFIAFAIFYLFPLAYCFFVSIEKGGDGTNIYIQLFHSSSFLIAIKNTLVSIAVMTPSLLIVAFGIALVVNKGMERKSKWWMGTLFIHMVPFLIPSVVITHLLNWFFSIEGPVSKLIMKLGCEPVNLLQSKWIFGILFLVYLWKNYGYCMIILLGGIRNIPKETIESAQIDGAKPHNIIFSIVIPQMKSFVSFSAIISMIAVFKLYRESFLLFGNYPSEEIYYIQNFINNSFYSMSYGRVAGSAVLLSIFFCGVILFLYWQKFKEGDI